MFGFGEKSKLRKLGNELKGASLREVIERFADKKNLNSPSVAYDGRIALRYDELITSDDAKDISNFAEKIKKITAENNFPDGSHLIYLSYNTSKQLDGYAIDLMAATILIKEKTEIVAYLFDNWLNKVPAYYVLPIIFPAKNFNKIEEYRISRDLRNAMIDGLFERLGSIKKFQSIVNDYAEYNPYFRDYPL